MKKPVLLVVAAFTVGFVLSGCGSGTTTTVTTTAQPSSVTSTAASSTQTTTGTTTGTTTSTTNAAKASVTYCSDKPYGSSSPVSPTSAAGLSCADASAEQASYSWTGNNTFTTAGGFSCTPSGRGAKGYQIRCVNGAKSYRIEFSD